MRVLFLGPPGAGKGTQAESVAAHLSLAHVSTGDMFRSLDTSTELGGRVKAMMEAGDLIPDAITIEMLEARLEQSDAAQGYILDGFPRTLAQAKALDDNLGDDGLDHVVVLEVPRADLLERLLSRGRADDTAESVANRLDIYAGETEPLIAFYEPRGIVSRIVGAGEIGEITKDIIEALVVS